MAGLPHDELIAGLIEDVALLKSELVSERWNKVSLNFDQAQNNFAVMNERLSRLEAVVYDLRRHYDGAGGLRPADAELAQPADGGTSPRTRNKRTPK